MRRSIKVLLIVNFLFCFFIFLDYNYHFFKNASIEQGDYDLKMKLDTGLIGVDDSIDTILEECETCLSHEGTSVESELQKMLSNYQNLLIKYKAAKVKDLEKINNIERIVKNSYDMLASYTKYQEIKKTGHNSYQIEGYGNFDLIGLTGHAAAHAAVVAYFSSNNYVLAAELLTHMKDNKDYDSIYKPINSFVFGRTNEFTRIANLNEYVGSGDYENRENILYENDMYYAVNKYGYSKSRNNDLIVLTDRYDFDSDIHYDNFLSQSAVNAMYLAQEDGFLTPFYTVIELENSINLNNDNYVIPLTMSDWRYTEYQATLSKHDTIVYSLKFNTTGYRNIQTFGYNDTFLMLEYDDESIVTLDNDSGYDKNAMILWRFLANVEYRLVLRMNDYEMFGNVRIGITPSEEDSYDGLKKIKKTFSFLRYDFQDVEVNQTEGTVSLFTLQPLKNSPFIIQTVKKDIFVDTYLFFIDPRRGDVSKENADKKYFSCIKDDDSGGNGQAKISLVKQNPQVQFLIIACHYFDFSNTAFCLNISGLN